MSSSSLDYAALSKTLNSMHHLRIDPGHLTLHLNPSVPLSDSISEGVQKALLDGAVVVAVKQLSFRSGDPTNRIAFRIARELKVWAMLHHPHILSLIGFHLDLARHNAWIISPYLANGNVTNFLKVELLGQTARLKLLLQAAQGIMYLHENDPPIIHGGIKASNVLVNDAGQAVITDFALATIVMDPGLHSGMTTSVTTHGSYRFLAPELIQGEPASLESDIWSFGCLMIEIACDRTPFQDISSEARVILKVIQGFMPDNVSTLEMPMDLKGLLMGCWEKEPKQRPSIERCCSALELAISDLAYDVELPEGDHWVRFDGDSLSGLGSQGSSPPPSPTRPFNVSPENELPGQLAIDDKYDAIRGRYADLMFGQWVRPNGRIVEVAVKYMRQIVVGTGRDSQVQTAEQRVTYEASIWGKLRHPYILPLLGFRLGPRPCLISPRQNNGNLSEYLEQEPELRMEERLRMILQVGKALSYMHAKCPPVCHGDVKPANVLISDSLDTFLCDFGFSRVVEPGSSTLPLGLGTRGFQAPEIFSRELPSCASDVFAFGGLMLAVLSGKPPFYGLHTAQVLLNVSTGKRPSPEDHPQLPQAHFTWNLMQRCWSPEANDRPSMEALVTRLEEGFRDMTDS